MTLIELLITITVLGTIAVVTAAALLVVFSQQNDTEARLNVARWEQSLATWLPADLSSATDVDDDPALIQTGCSIAACSEGLNALYVAWQDGGQTVSVSYRYGPSDDDDGSYVLTRVECRGSACSARVALRDLDGPRGSDGELLDFASVTEVPNSVIDVTLPLDVNSTDPDADGDETFLDSPVRRVIVEVNGKPGADGEVRSSRVSLTAGGDNRTSIDPPEFEGINFTEARSNCGGPTTLVLDTSGSISGNVGDVEDGVVDFVRAFDGTPTDLEVIEFNTASFSWSASVGGETITRFDMTNADHVEALIGPDGNGGLANSLSAGGGTNWEDALHRTFYRDDGSIDSPRPKLVVFFTDGEPTFSRTSSRAGYDTNSADGSPVGPPTIESPYNFLNPTGGTLEGSAFNPTAWYRADYIVGQFESEVVGVGIGSAFTRSTSFGRDLRDAGWPSSVPNEAFLGKLIAGGQPHQYDAGSPGYVKRTYSGGSWGDVSNADILTTSNWSALGDALKAIALVDCGGTLTVQTRDTSGSPADGEVTYQVGSEVLTTTRVQKARTADVALDDGTSATIDLIPSQLGDFTAESWKCRAGGDDMVLGDEYQLLGPTAADGIAVTVSANEAVSCTLTVS